MVVDEGANFIEAMSNNGRTKHPAGLRLYNQKYYAVNVDQDKNVIYLKKVKFNRCSLKEEAALPSQKPIIWLPPSTSKTKWKMERLRTLVI